MKLLIQSTKNSWEHMKTIEMAVPWTQDNIFKGFSGSLYLSLLPSPFFKQDSSFFRFSLKAMHFWFVIDSQWKRNIVEILIRVPSERLAMHMIVTMRNWGVLFLLNGRKYLFSCNLISSNTYTTLIWISMFSILNIRKVRIN